MQEFADRWKAAKCWLLDGATGTELQRRGIETRLPLWSAAAIREHPQVLLRIHADYRAAGAEILTANTFRTHARNLAPSPLSGQAAELTREAVEIARRAADGRAYVAGSQAPLEDCYRPDLVPPEAELQREHAAMARTLAASQVDLILVETHPTIREAAAATRAAVQTGLPVFVSLICGEDGRLLSGESVSAAAQALLPLAPLALLVNCCPAPAVERPLRALREAAPGIPRGAYANVGRADPVHGWINTDAQDPAVYARYAAGWLDLRASVIGGCCGTTPAHIRALRDLLESRK